MRSHFAAVPVHSSAEAERELKFLGSHRVLGVDRHLVADGAQSVWTICVAETDTTSPDPTSLGQCGDSGCPVERSPELYLSGFRTWRP